MKLLNAIPALPVGNIQNSATFFCDKLGFRVVHFDECGFAILQRDAVELHLWAATDESWQMREGTKPVVSGAESFIAGTASCRIGVINIDELHDEVFPMNINHPNAPLRDTDFGTREFGVLDIDGNLITFFERVSA